MHGRTALVLSAGMMFGAYQAGVWRVLARLIRPDLVIGVSSGALNAWAIAGGCSPERLADFWLDPAFARVIRFRFPFPPWFAVFDSARLAALARKVHSAFRPQTEVVVAATQLPGLRPRLFRGGEITWKHLAASCSFPFGFRPVRIGGGLYVDGGFLGALPLWAAAETGATRAIAIDALPKLPSVPLRGVVKAVRLLATRLPAAPAGLALMAVAPERPLGSLRDLVFWRRDNIERWLEQGRRDAEACAGRLGLPLR